MATESVVEIVLRVRNELRDTLERVQKQLTELNNVFGKDGGNASASGINRNTAALRELSVAATAATVSTQGTSTGLMGIVRSAENAILSVRGLVGAVSGLAAVQIGRKLAAEAGRAEVLNTVLTVVGTNAGFTSEQLEKLDKSVQKMGITIQASRSSITQLIQAQLINASNTAKAAELARAAQDLAVVTGQNSSDTFARLVINIQQMDTVGLRWMGLMVDRNRAEKEYAALLGKTASDLGLVEKRQAFMNAAMREATKLSGSYEASMANASKQIQSLPRYVQDLQVAIGEAILPSQLAIVEEYTKLLQNLREKFEGIGKSDGAVAMGAAVRTLAGDLRVVLELLADLVLNAGLFIGIWVGKKFYDFVVSIVNKFRDLGTIIELAVPAMKSYADSMERAARASQSIKPPPVPGVVPVGGGGSGGGGGGDPRNSAPIFFPLPAGKGFPKAPLLSAAEGVAAEGAVARLGTSAATAAGKVGLLRGAFQALKLILGGIGAGLSSLLGPVFLAITAFELLRAGYNAFQASRESADNKANRPKEGEILTEAEFEKAEALIKKGEDLTKKRDKLLADQQAYIDTLPKGKVLTDSQKATIQEYQNLIDQVGVAQKKGIKDYENFVKETSDPEKQEALRNYPFNRRTDANAIKVWFDGVKQKMEDGRKALQLDKFVIEPELGIFDAKFREDLSAARERLRQYLTPDSFTDVTGEYEQIEVSIDELILSYEQLAKSASTPLSAATAFQDVEELERRYNETRDIYSTAALDLSYLKDQLKEKFDTTTLNEVNSKMKYFSDGLKELGTVYQSQKTVVDNTLSYNQKLASTFVEMGVSASSAVNGFATVNTAASSLTSRIQELNQIDLTNQTRALENVKIQYQSEVETLAVTTARKKELVESENINYGLKAQKMAVLDSEFQKQRLAAAETYYKRLVDLQNQAFEKWKATAEKVKAIDKQIFDDRKAMDIELREMQRSTLSQTEQLADIRREMAELDSQASIAIGAKQYSEAISLLERRRELARSLVNYASDEAEKIQLQNEASQEVKASWESIISTRQLEKAEASAAAAEQFKNLQMLTQEVNTAASQLNTLAVDRISTILVEVDSPSLDAAARQIENRLKSITAQLSLKINGGTNAFRDGGQVRVPRFSTGGAIINALLPQKHWTETVFNLPKYWTGGVINQIMNPIRMAIGGLFSGPGTGTSDSILAMVSNGEYIHREKAVSYYGTEFMDAINNLLIPKQALPRFAEGGAVAAMQLTAPTGLGTTGLRDSVDVNFNLGGKRFTLMGEREQVRGLVNSLKGLEVSR